MLEKIKDKKMLEKISDFEYEKNACSSPEHNPPMNIYLTPGRYKYTCPSCGNIIEFTVPLVTC